MPMKIHASKFIPLFQIQKTFCKAFCSNQIDIGLVEGQVVYADVDVETFMQDEMKLVVPPNHPLLRTNEINERTLQDQVWVLRESGSGTRAYSDRFIHQHHLK